MELSILRNEEYAAALKSALAMRREGTIDRDTDNQLGLFAFNIAQWAIAQSVVKGQLWRSFSCDPDFNSDVLCVVVAYLDRVNLDREPKEILVYLYRVARSAIRDLVKKEDLRAALKMSPDIGDAAALTYVNRPSADDPVIVRKPEIDRAKIRRYRSMMG